MNIRSVFLSILVAGLFGCSTNGDYLLDESIPRLQSPDNQIAYFRVKYRNGEHIETAFYDHQNRILENFIFGRSSAKVLNGYTGDLLTTTIRYEHSDSSEPGYVSVDTLKREYDSHGMLVMDSHHYGVLSKSGPVSSNEFNKRYLSYAANGDTIINKTESSYQQDSSQIANISKWEKDINKRLKSYLRLYVILRNPEKVADTIYYYSQRYAYDDHGRLSLAWFDHMYLGQFYMVAGPDTIRYHYDSQNRLIEEKHRYTIDMRNKQEADTAGLPVLEKESRAWHKNIFFVGKDMLPNNDRVDLITYRYEKYNPAKRDLVVGSKID